MGIIKCIIDSESILNEIGNPITRIAALLLASYSYQRLAHAVGFPRAIFHRVTTASRILGSMDHRGDLYRNLSAGVNRPRVKPGTSSLIKLRDFLVNVVRLRRSVETSARLSRSNQETTYSSSSILTILLFI